MMIHQQYPVAVYTIAGCPYCKKAIKLLRHLGIPFKARNVGSNAQLAVQLYRETGSPSVPKIFINGRFIGGFDRLQALAESGQLAHVLAQ